MRILTRLLLLMVQSSAPSSSLSELELLVGADNSQEGGKITEGITGAMLGDAANSGRQREVAGTLSHTAHRGGREEFALQRDQREAFAEVHLVRGLGPQQEIPLHACGTHARWYNPGPGDFPAYVDVAPTGPAQIQADEELGHELTTTPGHL